MRNITVRGIQQSCSLPGLQTLSPPMKPTLEDAEQPLALQDLQRPQQVASHRLHKMLETQTATTLQTQTATTTTALQQQQHVAAVQQQQAAAATLLSVMQKTAAGAASARSPTPHPRARHAARAQACQTRPRRPRKPGPSPRRATSVLRVRVVVHPALVGAAPFAAAPFEAFRPAASPLLASRALLPGASSLRQPSSQQLSKLPNKARPHL